MTSLVTQQIIEQLKDESHPPIILLNGDWGVGKTHLIEHELKNEIEASKQDFGDYHYLSAYGMKNVTDFQDQVVSLYLSNQKEGSSYVSAGLEQVGNFARLLGADKSESGLVQGVMSGLTGAVRQSTLQNLSDMTIILDDLERLTDSKTIADILGTCLRFAEHNKKIKIIVVANEDALQDKSKVEKTFSDIIKLSRSSDELISILSEIYTSEFEFTIKVSLQKSLAKFKKLKLNINNLRVLQRSVNRIIKLKNRVDTIEGLDLIQSHQIITQQIIGVCFLIYAKSYTEKDFNDFLDNDSCWNTLKVNVKKILAERNRKNVDENISEDEQKILDRDSMIRTIFDSIGLSKDIVNFCFTNLLPSYDDDEIVNKLGLPMETSPLDQMIKGYFFNLSEEDFLRGSIELEQFLFNGEGKDYAQWLAACEAYIFFINNNYIEKNKTDELDKLKNILAEGNIIDPLSVGNGSFSRRHKVPHEINNDEFKSLLGSFVIKSKQHKNEEFRDAFYNNWEQAISDSLNNYENESFLHNLDATILSEKVMDWKGSDIIEFISFVKARYAVSNARDHYKEEWIFIPQFIDKLKLKQEGISGRLKAGMLYELIQEFESILKRVNVICYRKFTPVVRETLILPFYQSNNC